MKKAIIIGATSGIGQEVAKCLLLEGWKIGVAGRRQSSLENLQRAAPDQIQIQALDVTQEDASEKLNLLIDKLGGMDLFLLSSGNRGGSLTLLFSFRVRCVIPSSLSSLHFGLTKIAKIMQNHRRILLKCIFLVGIFFSDGKS